MVYPKTFIVSANRKFRTDREEMNGPIFSEVSLAVFND